jgi:hypothetical protein
MIEKGLGISILPKHVLSRYPYNIEITSLSLIPTALSLTSPEV